MPQYLATIIAALIGALLGSVLVAILENWYKRKAEIRLVEEKLLDRYLLQFQDAVESLWFRLKNIREEGGRKLMDDSYYEVSTLYALGRVLAYERILLLDGVYLQLRRLKKFDNKPGPEVKERLSSIEKILDNGNFHRYDRMALAEAVTERDAGLMRTKGYLDFKYNYEVKNSRISAPLQPAKAFVETVSDQVLENLMGELFYIAKRLSTTLKNSSFVVNQ